MKSAVALLVLYVVGCHGYATGPPVQANPDICTSLEPHHGAAKQTIASPYQILTPSPCYKEGEDVPVFLRVRPGEQKFKYFEGLFILARNDTSDLTRSFGTFSKDDDHLQLLNCYGQTASAIGHNQKKHWLCKKFMWRAPANFIDDVFFHGTVVKNKATYWVGVGSTALSYNSTCAHDITALNSTCLTAGDEDLVTTPAPAPATTQNPSGSEGLKGHVMSVVMVLFFVSVCQFQLF